MKSIASALGGLLFFAGLATATSWGVYGNQGWDHVAAATQQWLAAPPATTARTIEVVPAIAPAASPESQLRMSVMLAATPIEQPVDDTVVVEEARKE